MKKNHHFNYQPVLNQYQTIVLRNKFRQIINDYYQINLQLLSVQLPIIYELDQNNYFDLLHSINFSTNQNNKTYQLISDHRANLVRFLQAHDLIAENGVYYNGWFFDKQSDQSKNNIINEYDFLELKIRIVDTNRLFIVDQFNEFWQVIVKFIDDHIPVKNRFYQTLTEISNPFLDLEVYQNPKRNFSKKYTNEQLKSLVYTNKIIICQGANNYNQFLTKIYRQIDLNLVWNLIFVDQTNQPQLLMAAFFDQIEQNQISQTSVAIFFHFSLALALVSQKLSITELNFLYCAINQ